MDPNAPIKYSDLFQEDDSIIKLQQQLKDLSDQYKTLMNDIKAQAAGLKAALSSVSGATSQGQQTIKNVSSTLDTLIRKKVELQQAHTAEAQEIAKVNLQLKEQNTVLKLNAKEAAAQKGSYDALSAEYSRHMQQLNKMSKEEKETSEEGRALVARARELRLEMKQAKEATGDHTLSVGDYGIAMANLASDIRNGIQALTQIRIEMMELEKQGQKGSDRWNELSQTSQRLSKDLKNLKREYQITKLETNALGQQTMFLNDVVGALSAGTGGLSALTGTVSLFGGSASGAAEALVRLNSAMAIANGVSQAWNALYKQGNTLLFVRTLQTKAATVAQKLQTKATLASAAAQAVLNAFAAANPYVLLASAIAIVVGALALWVSGNARLIKSQKLLNQQISAQLDYMEAYDKEATRIYRENEKALQQELDIAKTRKASYAETQKLENQIQAIKERNNAASRQFYKDEIRDIDANRKELERLREELLKAQQVQKNKRVEVQLDAEGPAKKIKASKVIEIIQDKINNLNRKVEIATELTYDQQQLDADAKALAEQHKQEALEVAALERSALRGAEDVQLSLLNNRFTKQRQVERANIARQIVDLKVQLQTESNLTIKARKAINEEIVNLQKQLIRTLEDISNEEQAANREAFREMEDVRLEALQDTADKQREVLKTQYEREIEDLQVRLATERDLTDSEAEAITQQLAYRWAQYQKDRFKLEEQLRQRELEKESESLNNQLTLVSENTQEAMDLRLQAIENQRQAELSANRERASDVRQDEAEINRKYDQLALQETIDSENEMAQAKLEVEQQYEESVFNLRMRSDREVARFQLIQQRERLRVEIEAQRRLLAIQTGTQKELTEKTIQTLENQILAIDRKIREGAKVNNIWELFGFDSDAADAIKTITDQVLDSLREITQARIDAAEEALSLAQKEVDASRKFWEYELEARANGYANMADTARKELELNRKKEAEALAIKKKAQQDQANLDTLTQISSLVTASANIWSGLGAFPPAAIAGIALMWTSFLAAKVKAAQIARESYGEGTVELLQGGSHQSGKDVDLGTKPDGTRRRAEGGEFFAVINKRNSRKYRDVIPDVIKSLNNGTFASRYMSAYNTLGDFALATSGGSTDVSQLERDVEAIKEQNATKIYTDSQGRTVFVYKNLIRKVKN